MPNLPLDVLVEPAHNLALASTLTVGSASGYVDDGSPHETPTPYEPKYTDGDSAYNAAVAAGIANDQGVSTGFYSGAGDASAGHFTDTKSVYLGGASLTVGYNHEHYPQTGPAYSAISQATSYHLLYESATNYVKVYWTEVIRFFDETGAPAGGTSNDRSDEYIGAAIDGNYSISLANLVAGPQQWNSGAVFMVAATALKPPDPSTPTAPTEAGAPSVSNTTTSVLSIENIRWSCLRGYIPPVDGSSNGFPGYVAPPPDDS